MVGRIPFGRFGHAMARLGDINADGFEGLLRYSNNIHTHTHTNDFITVHDHYIRMQLHVNIHSPNM